MFTRGHDIVLFSKNELLKARIISTFTCSSSSQIITLIFMSLLTLYSIYGRPGDTRHEGKCRRQIFAVGSDFTGDLDHNQASAGK